MADQTRAQDDTEAPGRIDPVRLATIRNNHRFLLDAARQEPMRRLEADNADVGALLAELDAVLAALDSAQERANRLADERAGWRSIAGADEIEAERDAAMMRAARVGAERDRLAARVAELELVPRCGAMTPSAFINAEPLGPCILDHGHAGMHQEASPAQWPGHPGAQWTDRNDPLAVERHRNAELAARVAELQVELDSEGHQTCLDWQKMRAERDEAQARVAVLEAEREQPDGDETRGYEWATRTPDGTRTGWDAEDKARRFARHHPHLKVDCREIRHFVGRWREAEPEEPAIDLPQLEWRWHRRPDEHSTGALACNLCVTGNVAVDLETGVLMCLKCGASAPEGTKASPLGADGLARLEALMGRGFEAGGGQ